jgi:hypothetical protein
MMGILNSQKGPEAVAVFEMWISGDAELGDYSLLIMTPCDVVDILRPNV